MPQSNNDNELREAIRSALQAFGSQPLREASIALLKTLGYSSDRTGEIPNSDPEAFLDMLEENESNTKINKEKALFDDWKKADLLFQLTDVELSGQANLLDSNAVETGLLQSYLFFAIELSQQDYPRGKLTHIARQLNRAFPMPVMVFIKHSDSKRGDLLSIAVINRRRSKRDADKDVLGKVTIIRGISINDPHRGHLDILNSFARPSLATIHSFDALHAAWEEIFNVELLNERFYKDIFKWYFWALHVSSGVRFPDDENKTKKGSTKTMDTDHNEKLRATGLIRMLTRLIFCWYLKEKGLIPGTLFNEDELRNILKNLDGDKSTYYHAILQNLFFATLNQRMGKDSKGKPYRKYAKNEGFLKNRNTYGIDNLYRYEDLFKDPEAALKEFEDIPFLNGGLFDCQDYLNDKGDKIYVDGFSRNPKKRSSIPNCYFFGEGKVNMATLTGDGKRGIQTAKGLIHILSAYKFTIVENTPIDKEIALDPELLGKVFENLLASYNEETRETARKQTGSFYTPRPIVEYMVDESLKAYLTTALDQKHNMSEEDARVGLDILFAYTEKLHLFEENEVDTLIKAIDACKILDPACGSGAFPMGILHKLVYILSKLDPDNNRWKQTQLAKLDSVDMRDELERIFESNNDDYSRKLYLIENCLYGVDIQPVAVQLSKLRFLISLICDQKTNRNKAKNHGIRPLPNLETRFVAADTLISLGVQMHLSRTQKILDLEGRLQTVRHNYFLAQRRDQKLRLQAKDKELREELVGELATSFADQKIGQELADWNLYDPRNVANFFEPLWMFPTSNMFDVVIGNPPYRQIQKFSLAQKRDWEAQRYQTYAKAADIYCLFYERGAQLLREGGNLCYITSNKWMRTGYGEKLRQFLSRSVDTKAVLDFGMTQNFEAATVDTCVLHFTRQVPRGKTQFCYASDEQAVKSDPERYFKDNSVIHEGLNSNAWVVLPKDRQRIKELVEKQGVPLASWDIQINYGVKTGLNEAFYITTSQRDTLVAKDPNCQEIIVPLLRGRCIKRYSTKWDGTWIINAHNGIHSEKIPRLDTKQYPSIWKHLSKHKDELSSRSDKGDHWSNLRDCAYIEEFEKPKVIYPDITQHFPFYFDGKGHFFVNDTAYIVTSSSDYMLTYLTAILNSSLFRCCFRDNFSDLGRAYRPKKQFFTKIPIKKPTDGQVDLFSKLVSMVQLAKKNDDADEAQVTFLEELIDACVMECYFHDHMRDKDLLFQASTAQLVDAYDPKASEQKQRRFIADFYQTANAPKHPIHKRLSRITSDSPDILAVIKKYGKV